MRTWRLVDEVSSADSSEAARLVSDGVVAHGRGVAALAGGGDATPLACFVHDDGALVAGLVGRTEFGRLFVHWLWVTAALRGQGLGSAVLARAEMEAQARGCADALIETLEAPTARLYERLGYRRVAVLPYVGPFSRHTLIKPLQRAGLGGTAAPEADREDALEEDSKADREADAPAGRDPGATP